MVTLPRSRTGGYARARFAPVARALTLAIAMLLAACPRPVESRPALGASTQDPAAEQAFRAARTALDEGRPREAEMRLVRFRERWPRDALVPTTSLLLGQIALDREDVDRARALFAEASRASDGVVRDRARFYDAVARHRAGDSRGAASVLVPMVGRTTEPDETTLLLRTLAESYEALGQRVPALRYWDRLATGALPDDEIATLRAGIVGLVDALGPEELERALDTLPPSGFAWPVAARRAIRRAFEAGDLAGTRALVDRVEAAGLPLDDELRTLRTQAERREQVQPYSVGVVLPLTGSDRARGQDALRGLMIAAGLPLRGPPRPDTFRLAVRDDTGDPLRAATAIDELVREERVIAIVGPLAPDTAAAAAARAEALSVPIVLLAEPAEPPLATAAATSAAAPQPAQPRFVLTAFTSVVREAAALVEHAAATGRRRIAVLRPHGTRGDLILGAIRAEAASNAAEVGLDAPYGPDDGGLARAARGLRGGGFDALLVVSEGRGGPRAAHIEVAIRDTSPDARPLVMWTAASWDAALVAALVREAPGAVITRVRSAGPGTSGGEAELASGWSGTQQSGDPGIAASFAFDAFRAIRQVVVDGARSRSAALGGLLSTRLPDGATAGRRFDSTRSLSPAVRVLRVVEGRLEPMPM